ncbi:unnamed protein product [Cladocopium goreaui]|uniref:Kinase D-interacting substrate of 220 kDa B (Ankyrin repeat-rich membrane-spanning protein B) n=1 Tax=Cladocopium goreaui TaxID=2562237 RepID=A0A9P1FTB2_9DINO|nr:unnamed protein product [Cladocopium goreaui]
MFIRCVYLKRKLVHTLDLRFEVGEPRFVQELALQSAWSCMLACLSFFWPFAILEAVSLVNIVNELGGGNVDWVRYVWPRALQVGACSLQVIVASALTAVSFLAGSSRCFQVFKRLPLELLWAAIAILAFVLLWTSRPDPELSPTKQSWSMLLISLVIFCLPLRFHISWFVFLVAIIMLPFDSTIASPDSYLLGFTILCACRLSWINERVLRRLFEIDPPLPCFVPTINSADGWIGSSSPAKQEMGMSMGSLGRGVKERNNRGSKGSQTCQGYDVEKMLSRDSGGVEDTFPVRNIDRSDKHRCMILPLREDFTIREVSEDVRLQIGYDIQGKHLATILNPHSFDDIDFQSEAMYQVSDVVVCFASGPSPAKLCMLRTDLPDPAFFAMITPFSEVPSHSSPSVLGDLSHGNQSMMRIASIKSQPGKTPSRRASDSRLISESLIYSKDSHTDGHSADGFWPKELRDVNIQTEASTADSECQTDPIYSGIGALCRRCQRPPTIPMKRQGSGMYSSGGDPVDFLDTSEASEDFAALSPAEVLIQRIQGFWVLHQGPKNTAPWLQSFLVRGSEAESQEDTLEIRTESERVYMAGGVRARQHLAKPNPEEIRRPDLRAWIWSASAALKKQCDPVDCSSSEGSTAWGQNHKFLLAIDIIVLSLDEDPDGALEGLDGLLHRYGQSGTHLVYTRQDVQTELNISEPNGLGSKVEAEADETDIENCGDILQAAKEGHVGACRRLLQVDPQSLEQVDEYGDGPLHFAARKGRLEVVQVLLAAGASVEAKNDATGKGPLAWAATGGHPEVVQALLAAGASVEAKNSFGRGPQRRDGRDRYEPQGGQFEGNQAHEVMKLSLLGCTASERSDQVVVLVLVIFTNTTATIWGTAVKSHGWSPPAVDVSEPFGKTPLHYAAKSGHTAVMERLLAAGAAVDAADNEGWLPLHSVAFNGHTAVVEQLLAAGAAVDAVDSKGKTPLHRATDRGHSAVVEQLLAAGAAVDAVDSKGKTPYDIAKDNDHRKVMGVLDPVFVALLSGRSCKCSSYHETVQELKEEAEKKLGITIQRLIGVNMEPLNEAKTLKEAGVLPGHTLTAVIAPAAGQGDVSEEKQLPEDEGDLQNPNDFIEFLISANIRLVRAEFLIELDETGTPMPRRQEAEFMHVQSGATALVELGEYKELHVNQTSGHVTIRTAEGPSIVRFRSISHMWEAMEHPDPWGFQVRSIVERYRELPKDSVTWVFVDFLSLYQYKRSAEEDEFFRKGLKRMHWLYSHEIVQVDILTELTPEDKKFEGEILVYNATEDQVKVTPICELRLNNTPYELRGWCQSESEWSRLRMDVLGGCIPTPPEIFRKRMQRMRFTHRNDAEQVLALQEKVFRDKVSRTTHLQLQQLSGDDLECLHDALPHYTKLEYMVVNGNALKGQDAAAMVTSGAADIQMESCSLQDEDAGAISEALMSSAADRLEHLSLTGNRFSDIGTAALRKVMEQRPPQICLEGLPVTCANKKIKKVTPQVSHQPKANVAMRDAALHDVVTAASAPWTVPKKVGQSFAELTRIGLARAKGMVAFCTSDYGAYTGAGYETFHELEYAHDNKLHIFPIRQADEPEKNLAVEHALSRKPFGRLLQAVPGNSTFMAKDGQDTSAGRPRCEISNFGIYAVLTLADHAGLEAIFQHLDPTGSGTLGKEELLSILSGLGVSDKELALLQTTEMFQDQRVPYSRFLRWIFAPASNSESGHQTDVASQDVQTELNISEPNDLGSKVEAEADETEIESCGDILQAAEEGNVGAVGRLLQVDRQSLEQVNTDGMGPLHLAAAKGHLEVVEALLAAGASVEAKDGNGSGPLHFAAFKGHLEVVEALLAAGASVEAKNDNGCGPQSRDGRDREMEFATLAGDEPRFHQYIVLVILINTTSDSGCHCRTPLHWAALYGHTAAVEQLLAAGAAVDAVGNQGILASDKNTVASTGATPLHYAALNGHTAAVEQLLAAGAAVDALDSEGKTPYDYAKKMGRQKVMGVLDPVFVALLSGRSCKCSSYHETVQELKEEAEHGVAYPRLHKTRDALKKLGITIQRLIGVNMEPLNEAKTLGQAGVLPGHTLTAVIAPAAGQGDVSEEKQLAEDEGDLQNPNDFIEFLISANIRLVRAEFLIELDETGTPMPRRQEAEFMHVQSGATALVELGEYKELHVNQTSGHVTIRTAEGPSTVRFRSISHMWEAMEHPDPWGFQVASIVERYRELPTDSVTWVFVDFMSLYQYKRSAEEDEFFRKGLKRMHWLYSHEIVQVDILTELTPEDKKFEGEILVYNATEDQVKVTPICELRLNNTPYELRGWCQSESEWSRLRMDVLGGCIPTPPDIFRKRMQRMRFTHRNDAEQVLALQEKVFRDKVSRTTHLQLQQLSADDLECLRKALPHYNKLKYMVVNGNALKGQDAVAMVTSGAADIQMESCSLQDEDADAMAEALMSSAADRLEHLSLTGNRFSDIGTAALRKVMEQRPQLKIRL